LKAMLTRYLKQFDDCFARRDTQCADLHVCSRNLWNGGRWGAPLI
jgi:hypothetical protein